MSPMIYSVVVVLSMLPPAVDNHRGAGQGTGRIIGVVTYDGTPPERHRVKVTTQDKPCHAEPIPNESVVVSRDGKIRWAVVSIKRINGGKSFGEPDPEKPVVLDQRGCRFRPHVVVVPRGQPLRILNNDGVLHNVHLYPKRNKSFNRIMLGSQKTLDMTFDLEERIPVRCDVHQWMAGWIVVAEHPYYAVTDKNGVFKLDKVPQGTYTVQLWHEKLGRQNKDITVTAGEETRLDFAMRGN
ncbi:MAG: carboxypeptidase regulatory-like domain-containing protein [Phycisphaerae bacterium]